VIFAMLPSGCAHRRTQGLKVEVVAVDELYNELGWVQHTPFAIRDFLQTAFAHWQRAPRFALLLGDSTWDPRNYLGVGDRDLVPTKLIDTALMETASDDWFVDFNDDGLPEMSIGRLPVTTAAEASVVVDKLISYDASGFDPERRAVFVADRGFESLSQQDQALLPAGTRTLVINRSAGTDSDTHARILAALNEGPRLSVSWAMDRWMCGPVPDYCRDLT